MGGTIWLESEVGVGSTFHFTARLKRDTARAAAPTGIVADLHDLRVLVVDDNETNRRILHDVLRTWKMTPTVVASSADALTAFEDADSRNRPFGLAIIDGQMPQMDGFMLAQRLKADRRFAPTPIVMLTSAVRPDDASKCRRLGIATHVTKPIKQSDLLDAIVSLFARHGSDAGEPSVESDAGRAADAAAAHPARRGQPRQPHARDARAREARARGRERRQRPRSDRSARARAGAVRPGADGRADAGARRLVGDRVDPAARARVRRAHCPSSR